MKDETSRVAAAHAARGEDSWFGVDEDADIDVRKWIKLLFKRKASILFPFLLLTAAVTVWSLSSPDIYEVSTVVEPPIAGYADSGSVVNLDTILNIKAKIESNAYEDKIVSVLNLDKRKRLGLKVDTKVNPALDATYIKTMKISVQEPADKTEIGKKVLFALLDALNQEHAPFLTDKLLKIDNQIKMIGNGIVDKENGIHFDNEQIKLEDDRVNEYLDEIKSTKDNSAKLLEKRESFLGSGGKDEISSLLYTTTIQQNLTYLSQLQTQLSSIKNERENKVFDIRTANNAIDVMRIQIENLKKSKGEFHGIVVIQEPLISAFPVGPRRLRNILAAGILGLVLGFLLVLLSEWWRSGSPLING